MDEPSPRQSRLALAAIVCALLLVGGGSFLLGLSAANRSPIEPASVPATVDQQQTKPQSLEPSVLSRVDLLKLAAAGADAAAGVPQSDEQLARLEKRRFEIRLPFGCNGPDQSDQPQVSGNGWRYDEPSSSLRIYISPVVWTGEDWTPPAFPQKVETVEGFWIERPWSSSEVCPRDVSATGATATENTVAVGQIFTTESSRSGRRNNQPYNAVIPTPKDELDVSRGLLIRLRGRLAGAAVNSAHCRTPLSPKVRPVCLVQVSIDEVAVENAATGETLATWDPAGASITTG